MVNSFEARVSQQLVNRGVPLATVKSDGITVAPYDDGYLLSWSGATFLTPQEAAALVGPHTDDETCPTCYGEKTTTAREGSELPLVYCYPAEAEAIAERQCTAQTRKGARCLMVPTPGSTVCRVHTPRS